MVLLERLNDSGELYLSHTRVAGRVFLRMAAGAPSVTSDHIAKDWATIRRISRDRRPA